MGLVTAADIAGYVIAVAFGGVVADLFDKRRLMVGEWSATVRVGRRRDRRLRSGGRAVRGAGSGDGGQGGRGHVRGGGAGRAGDPAAGAGAPGGLSGTTALGGLPGGPAVPVGDAGAARVLTMLLPVQTFVTLGVTDLLIFRPRHDLCPAISLPRGRRACAPG
jgi:hypothetical protein